MNFKVGDIAMYKNELVIITDTSFYHHVNVKRLNENSLPFAVPISSLIKVDDLDNLIYLS